jgi:dTDP-4-dehydrorhamnose reductase
MTPNSMTGARFLLLGAGGQVGLELHRQLTALGPVVAATRSDVDLERADSIERAVEHAGPTVVVNAAAYTAVDAAETDRDRCMRINAEAPGALARAAARVGALVVHYSTNYVFDGMATRPYREEDAPAPLGVYCTSKLLGEQAVVAEQARHLILRTSGVYGWTGTNFMRRMLELAHEREELRVVRDQMVSPTPASALAAATVKAIRRLGAETERAAFGTYHLTSAGAVSWFDFARAILARDPRRREQRCRVLTPISSGEFVTPALRPANGLLDNTRFVARFGFGLDDWETELDRVFATSPVPG